MTDRDAVSRSRSRVEEALGRWAERPDGRAEIRRIGLGFTNYNWRVIWPDRTSHFVKSPGEKTDGLIERQTAVDASRKVGLVGVAPQLLHVDAQSGVEVYEFLDGFRGANLIDLHDSDILAGILAGYRTVHRSQRFLSTATGFEQIEAHLHHLAQLNIALPSQFTSLEPALAQARDAIEASGIDLTGSYNDAHITNYMIGSGKTVKIIDWEYAGNNDPAWDLGGIAFESFMTPERERLMVELYYGSWRADAAARIYLYSNLTMMKWSLWALLQSHLSTMGYDFRQYGQFLLARAQYGISSPRWVSALRAV